MNHNIKSIQQILQTYFGHESFRGKQESVIRRVVEEKRHSLVIMPTGSGKSVCYQVPALYEEGGAIVISPLIALMQDQVDALKKKNIPASYINSTVSRAQRSQRLNQFVTGQVKLLYVTPERFRKPEFVEKIQKAKISLFAVDEAHCISEWGHDFRPNYSRLGEYRLLLKNPLTIALTATATPDVQNDIIQKLNIEPKEIKVFHQGIERPNLRLEAEEVMYKDEKPEKILRAIARYPGSGIIYFSLIKTLEEYSDFFKRRGIEHTIYHGKLDAKQRRQKQRWFMSPNALVLATNAFGMGIDKPDIRFVIHAQIPGSVESYYQEIGRAGRDDKPALCYMFFHQDDIATQMEFIRWSNPGADFYHRLYFLLQGNEEIVNQLGLEYLREELNFKNSQDFRLETALGMLDRYDVIEGSLFERNLRVIDELPEKMRDDDYLENKRKHDQKKLLSLVHYFRTEKCRRIYISEYFGFYDEKPCMNCDICTQKYLSK